MRVTEFLTLFLLLAGAWILPGRHAGPVAVSRCLYTPACLDQGRQCGVRIGRGRACTTGGVIGCYGQVTAHLVAGSTGQRQCRPPGGKNGVTQGDKTVETIALLEWMFDGLLMLTLLGLAWQALKSPDLFKAIVLFIAFGLAMALAWVRLQAIDIALAEAAIGAGLTGALLLKALAQSNELADRVSDDHPTDTGDNYERR